MANLHCCRVAQQVMCDIVKTSREIKKIHVMLGNSQCSRAFDDLKK